MALKNSVAAILILFCSMTSYSQPSLEGCKNNSLIACFSSYRNSLIKGDPVSSYFSKSMLESWINSLVRGVNDRDRRFEAIRNRAVFGNRICKVHLYDEKGSDISLHIYYTKRASDELLLYSLTYVREGDHLKINTTNSDWSGIYDQDVNQANVLIDFCN